MIFKCKFDKLYSMVDIVLIHCFLAFCFIFLSCEERKIINPVDTRFKLEPPQIITATQLSYDQVYIAWENRQEGVTGFNMYRKTRNTNFIKIAVLPDGQTIFEDFNLIEDSVYTYAIECFANENISEKRIIYFDTDLQRYGFTTGIITLDGFAYITWQDTSKKNVQKYIIEKRLLSNTDFVTIAELPSNINEFIDEDVISCETYVYRLRFCTDDNISLYLNPIVVPVGRIFKQRIILEGEDIGKSIIQAEDDNYVIFGSTYNNDNYDFQLIKIDVSGNILWKQTYGDVLNEMGYAFCQSFDGGFILVGSSNYTDRLWLDSDFLVIKTDTDGNQIWKKTYGFQDGDHALCICRINDFGYIIGGWSEQNYSDGYIINIDDEGNVQWSKLIDDCHFVHCIRQLNDGRFIIAGWAGSGGTYKGEFIAKMDQNGTIIWNNQYDCIENRIISAVLTKDGGFACLGGTNNPLSNTVTALKINALGDLVWSHWISSQDFHYFYPVSITELTDGNFVITGLVKEGLSDTQIWKILLRKISSNGQLIQNRLVPYAVQPWDIFFPGNNIIQTNDNGLIILNIQGENDYSDSDFLLTRIDPLGPDCDN